MLTRAVFARASLFPQLALGGESLRDDQAWVCVLTFVWIEITMSQGTVQRTTKWLNRWRHLLVSVWTIAVTQEKVGGENLSLRLSLSIHRYTVPDMHTPLHIYIHDDDTTKSMIWKEPRVNPLADCSRDPVPCTRLERRVCFAHGNLSSQNLWVWGTWLCNSC